MKANTLNAASAAALAFAIAGCIPQSEPPAPVPPPIVRTPAPTPTPTPTPSPTPAPVPVVQEPTFDNYLDAPQTPGTWGYENAFDGSTASFVNANGIELVIWCDKDTRTVGIDRTVTGASVEGRIMSIQTETASRQVPLRAVRNGSLTAVFASTDPILDAMAITKGRVAIGVEGERTLYLPAWVEIGRVIEDCR